MSDLDSNYKATLNNLASIGCGFRCNIPKEAADPERVLLDGLRYFWTDEKLFAMLLGVLVNRIHHLIHVERLVALAQNLSPQN
jgi:hypothetical protein